MEFALSYSVDSFEFRNEFSLSVDTMTLQAANTSAIWQDAAHTNKDPMFGQMYQLQSFHEDKHRVTSLTFGRLFASKMATRRKQEGDLCSAPQYLADLVQI